jgi:uncharacterized protein
MMRTVSRPWLGVRTILIMISAALSAGCTFRSAPVHFYMLAQPPPAAATAAAVGRGPTIGIGPVTLPRYLERINIVTRGDTEIEVSEYDRWAEPLNSSVPRLLASDLSTMLGTERVVMFPWPVEATIDRQVVVDVLRFEGTMAGDVVLDARWRVLGPARQELVLQHSVVHEAAGANGYPAVVAAMRRALGVLSREIAEAIKRVPVSSAPSRVPLTLTLSPSGGEGIEGSLSLSEGEG